jgi:hypothetical protein
MRVEPDETFFLASVHLFFSAGTSESWMACGMRSEEAEEEQVDSQWGYGEGGRTSMWKGKPRTRRANFMRCTTGERTCSSVARSKSDGSEGALRWREERRNNAVVQKFATQLGYCGFEHARDADDKAR